MDEGWLVPWVRVSLGLGVGLLLVAGGEVLLHGSRRAQVGAMLGHTDYVPPAVTAGGLFAAFASVYAAYALYALLLPVVTFVLLAGIGMGGVLLSLRQGPFVALLGLVGAYVTPALTAGDAPSAVALFSYLLFVSAACLLVVRSTAWTWLAWSVLVGVGFWVLLWMVEASQPGQEDVPTLGVFLIGIVCLFVALIPRRPAALPAAGETVPATPGGCFPIVGWAAAVTVGVFMVFLTWFGEHGPASLTVLAGFALLLLGLARRDQGLDGLAVVAGGASAVALLSWDLPADLWFEPAYRLEEGRVAVGTVDPPFPILATEYLGVMAGFGALFGLAGFAALWGARRPGVWAGLSVTLPLALFVAAYWQIEAFQVDLTWAVLALGLAGLALLAAGVVGRHRDRAGMTVALGIYAAAVFVAIGLGASLSLRQAELTVALSLLLPALAWISARLDLVALRPVAVVVAGAVVVRLVFNYDVLDYPLGAVPGLNWLLYGYGIPAVAFFAAARMFRGRADDALVKLLEAGTVLFVTVLVTLQVRALVTGALDTPQYGLFEQSLQSVVWFGLAYGLSLAPAVTDRVVLCWAWRLLAGVAAIHVVVVQALVDNPLWSGEPVGGLPGLNLLVLAYGVPALFGFLFSRRLHTLGYDRTAGLAFWLGVVLAFTFVSLEVRHAFQAPDLHMGQTTGTGEWYAYSMAWLVYGAALLVAGLAFGDRRLRQASLGVVMLAVGKVFVFDMAALTGLLRVLSFFGLGLALVAIGYVYQRFVLGRSSAPIVGRPLAG